MDTKSSWKQARSVAKADDSEYVKPDQQSEPGTNSDSADAGFEPVYASVDDWLIDWLLPTAAPRASASNRVHWCEQWHKHLDVVSRLTAAWLAWEHANYTPENENSVFDTLGNRSHWWAYHWAHHEPRIFGAESSMTSCKESHRRPAHALAAERLPTLRVVS